MMVLVHMDQENAQLSQPSPLPINPQAQAPEPVKSSSSFHLWLVGGIGCLLFLLVSIASAAALILFTQGRGKISTPITKTLSDIAPKTYACDRSKAAYLQEIPLQIIKSTSSNRVVNIVNGKVVSDSTETRIEDNTKASPQGLAEFRQWADSRGIKLSGITIGFTQLKDNQFDPGTNTTDLENLEFILNAYKGLKLLPESMVNLMRGKTIYISTAADINYAWYIHQTWKGTNDDKANAYEGVFLATPVSDDATVHEMGHILGNSLEGKHGNDQDKPFEHYRKKYSELFTMRGIDNLPCGYVSKYSTTNSAENFAEHFAFYVLEGEKFRERAKTDEFLQAKYDFVKELFAGKEYE